MDSHMSQPEIHAELVQPRGRPYRDDQIKPWSHYLEPIDTTRGRLAGNSRVWGDASPEVQSRVVDILIDAGRERGLTPRQVAHVLAIARIESGFNPDAAAGTTSASGLGQFVDRTGRSYGLGNHNRFDADAQANALVAHFLDNARLAQRRGQGEEYIYAYHHDGPSLRHGGLELSQQQVMPYVDRYERFVEQRLAQLNPRAPTQQTPPPKQTAPGQPPRTSAHASFQAVMDVMLPPQGDVRPHVTGRFGEHRSNGSHGGVDFNYIGGESGLNLRHPTVHSPVSGTVIFSGGEFGTVKIRDAQGNVHEILHLDTRSVETEEPIRAGDPIGTMGGRGPRGANQYAQHVHYQLRDPHGHTIDPTAFWHGRRIEAEAATRGAARSDALSDGMLKLGERGDDILGLQRSLNRLGYRDAHSRPLAEDGIFGSNTEEAVLAYQRANGLKVDGIAGPRTLTSIAARLREGRATVEARLDAPVALTHPDHPDHRLYAAIRQSLPASVPDATVAHATLVAKQNGIDSAERLQQTVLRDNSVYLMGRVPGFRARLDLDQPTPPIERIEQALLGTQPQQPDPAMVVMAR